MITKKQKEEVVNELQGMLKDSGSVVFANFHGLTVADSSAVRRALRAEGVSYKVAKKTLIKRALDSLTVKGERPGLVGELAVAIGSDPIAPARMVFDFQKKLDKKISILGGIFEGEYKTKEEMTSIAMIPSLQTLRGMFVNIINSPIQRFAIALNQIAEKKA